MIVPLNTFTKAKVAPAPKKEEEKVVVERPKAKRDPRKGLPMGTEVYKFKSWEVLRDGLVYTDRFHDQKAFKAAARAAAVHGRGTPTHARGTNIFWNTSIAQLKLDDCDFKVESTATMVTVGEIFQLPKVGCIISKHDLDASLASADNFAAQAWCPMGIPSCVLGVTSVCGAFTAWHDFLYAYLLMKGDPKYKFSVDKTCEAVLKNYLKDPDFATIGVVNMARDVAPENTTNIVFVAAISPNGIRGYKPGWTPFFPGVVSDTYFKGVSGVYPFGPVHYGKLPYSDHQVHMHNMMGANGFCYGGEKIQLYKPEVFKKAIESKDVKNHSQTIVIGIDQLVLKDKSGSVTYSDRKASWDYDCSKHQWKLLAPQPPVNLGEIIAPEDNPVMTKHKKVNIISSFVKKYSVKKESQFYWNSTCLKCGRTYIIDPVIMKEESLVEPKKASKDDYDEEDGEEFDENALADGGAAPADLGEVFDINALAPEVNETPVQEGDDDSELILSVEELSGERVGAFVLTREIDVSWAGRARIDNNIFTYGTANLPDGLHVLLGPPVNQEGRAEVLEFGDDECAFTCDPFTAWQKCNRVFIVRNGKCIIFDVNSKKEEAECAKVSFVGPDHVNKIGSPCLFYVKKKHVFKCVAMAYEALGK